MMHAQAADIMKVRQAEIEAAAAKEMERLGLTTVGSQEGTGGETPTVGEGTAERTPNVGGAVDPRLVREVLPAVHTKGSGSSGHEVPLTRKRRRTDAPSHSATSAVQASAGGGTPSPAALETVEAISFDRTPSLAKLLEPLAVQAITSLPPTKWRITRFTILPVPPTQASDPTTSSQSAPSGRRSITATFRLSTEDLHAPGDQPSSPQHQVYIHGRLARIWEEARAQSMMKYPGALADSHLEISTRVSIINYQFMSYLRSTLMLACSSGWRTSSRPAC